MVDRLRVAYPDPPYEGQASKHYRDQPSYAGEVDHDALIARLVEDFPDGWALSLKTNSLRRLLPLCPDDARVGAWVKPFAVIKANVRVSYAWEPVIWRGGRRRPEAAGNSKDWVSANIVMRNRNGTKGSKPYEFCCWMFELLGLEDGDEMVDLFPGSGAVTDAWDSWRGQLRIPGHGNPHALATPRAVRRAQLTMEEE